MVLKYYFDFLSQPSRALYIFMKLSNIPFEPCAVALRTGEQLTDEFKKNLSKFQKVPFIHDGDDDFRLTESVGIFRYLCRTFPVQENWYPKDSKLQARVDEYLEWQHMNIRLHCSSYFFAKCIIPMLTGRQPNPSKLKRLEENMDISLDKFVELFLSDGPFINGQTISFADILAACEIEQTRMAGIEPCENRPKLRAWLDRVRVECNPYYDEAHAVLNEVVAENKQPLQANL